MNPFTDEGFKRIFGQEFSKPLLIDFLNNLLEGERVITDLRFLDKEQLPEFKENRGLIYDVYCETDTGEHIIVEMQNRPQEHFKDRALLYLSKAIVSQSRRGKEGDSYELSAVYGVFFMNFSDRLIDSSFRADVSLSEMHSREPFSDKLRMIFLQLPLFTKSEAECYSYFERWIYILKHMEALNRMPWEAQHAIFKRLAEICETQALTPEERDRYEESLKVYRDNIAIAKYQKAKGRAEGIAEGEAKGRAEGRAEVARNLKLLGTLSLSQIAEATGLTEAEIEAL